MGKKLNLPFRFKSSETPFTLCTTPKTLSFRATQDIFKTMNSAYLEATSSNELVDTPKSCFGESIVFEESFSSAPEIFPEEEEDTIETVIRGLRSERLFFEPENKSIVQESRFPYKESLAMAVDSTDPFADFKKSMEEMVEAHGLKDWERLEELLTCYLKVNSRSNHGYIIGAFVDLLIALAFASNSPASTTTIHSRDLLHCSSSTTHSFTSPLSYSSSTSLNSPCLSSLEVDDDVDKSINNVVTSSSSVSY